MKKLFTFLYISILLFLSAVYSSQSVEVCDSLRTCIGRTLIFKVSSGKGAHYADVDNNDLLKKLSETMTVEMWLKPNKQAGKLQYIAGLWGPGEQKNDSWVIYISSGDSLTFELNGLADLGIEDNTIVRIKADTLYNNWNHFAFTFNGKSGFASIIINGILADSARNSNYPLSRLKKISNDELSIQLGSTNSISNNMDLNRTFSGWMDEIRIWGRAISPDELYCLKDKALGGKEDSLLLYYRCNDPNYVYTLCDVTGHNNRGYMRSGLSAEYSDRKDIIKVVVAPILIKDTVYCDNEKIYTFTIEDTSVCATGVYIRAYTGLTDKFRLIYNNKESSLTNWNLINLNPKSPVTFQVKVKCDFIGTIISRLEIRNINSCGWGIANIPLSITRLTELSMSKLSFDFDSLKARCIEKPFIDSTMKICNNTSSSGSPRDIVISSVSNSKPQVFSVNTPALPVTLKPGDCITVTIRFNSRDTSAMYYDTLKIQSTDKCASLALIPVKGKVKEVIGIFKRGTKNRLDSINFGKSCVNFPSDAVEYNWENLIDKDIQVTNIIIPANFTGKRFTYPVTLKALTGYLPNYFRFFPRQKGNFLDSIIFLVKSDGCTIVKPLYVKGIGYDAAISFADAEADFGTVIVGQESTLNVNVKNESDAPLTASIYMKQGDPFFLNTAKSISVPANSVRSFPLSFRPSTSGTFQDEVCIYENSCFQSFCIPVKGKAIIQRFSFEPEIMKILNVLGCESRDTTFEIKNISGMTQTLSNFVFSPAVSPFTLISPASLPASVTLNNNQSISFRYRYTPNDITNDRADKAFLNFESSDKEKWSAKLYATSIIPKLFLTEEILYPTIEVGATDRDTVILENISSFPILIDSINTDAGFNIIYPAGLKNRTLKPRDSINIIVDFVPTQDKLYNGELRVFSSAPCISSKKSRLTGRGIIIPLDAPLKVISFGFIKPCDCEIRTIPLINNSFTFDMSIDSVWIDTVLVTNKAPEFFSWYSFFSPDGKVPYKISPRATDTLFVKYCPRRPFLYSLVDNEARLNIKASGSGWSNNFTTYLAGKQSMLFAADTQRIIFSPTRVDTFAKSQYFHLKIPDLKYNPQRAAVKITNLTFNPDERVFYASDSAGRAMPIMLDTNLPVTVKIDFKPRAVRYYEEKFKVEIETPCVHFDTAVTVSGSGFAPAFGLNFNFDNKRKSRDTFKIVPCDTLRIPVFSSREIPANIVDINLRIGYDTNKLDYIGSKSVYLNEPCPDYIPSITQKYSVFGGSEFLLKNFCKPDSVRPLFIAEFLPKNNMRDTFNISVDSIKFDTEELILYHLIAENDYGTVIIQLPELKSINNADFDSVRVLDCKTDTLKFKNTGDVSLTEFALSNLPQSVRIINTIPAQKDTLAVGDTIFYIVQYCPRKKEIMQSKLQGSALKPCFVFDSSSISGIAYAPEFPVHFDVSEKFSIQDSLKTVIGDTLTIPIWAEKDFNDVFMGSLIWLEKLSFSIQLDYNPFALKFLNGRNLSTSDMTIDAKAGNIRLDFKNTDFLKAGKIAELDFLTLVPDSIVSGIYVSASDFTTDSVMFLDIVPLSTSSLLLTDGNCNLTHLNFTGVRPILQQNIPNPWSQFTEISFSVSEQTPVILSIYSSEGKLIKTLINGSVFKAGSYNLKFSSEGMSPGFYYYQLNSNTIQLTKTMLLVK